MLNIFKTDKIGNVLKKEISKLTQKAIKNFNSSIIIKKN